MVSFLLVFLAFALGLAVSFDVRDMFRAYTPNNVAGTTEAGHFGEEQKRKVRCKEPPSFSGEQDMFSAWLFSMEETIKALKPDDAVAFVGSYLEGNAKKWFMNLCTDGKRPASWNLKQLISAFKSEHDDERNRLLLVQPVAYAEGGSGGSPPEKIWIFRLKNARFLSFETPYPMYFHG